jgi:hypothetical protein
MGIPSNTDADLSSVGGNANEGYSQPKWQA